MGRRNASRYEDAIALKQVRARQSWKCHACGRAINPGQYYYRQSLGLIRKPPGVGLKPFCLACKGSPLALRLDKGLEYTTINHGLYIPGQAEDPVGSIRWREQDVQVQSLFEWALSAEQGNAGKLGLGDL